MKYRMICIAGIAIGLPAGAALAGDKDKMESADQSAAMTELDANGDGQISESEAAGTDLENRFASIDVDGDGSISAEEFESASGVGGPQSDETMMDDTDSSQSEDDGMSDEESGSY